MATTVTPLFARILVSPKKAEETTKSGIVLPETASKEKPKEGTVLSVGKECKAIKKGDVVLFKQYSPTEIKIDGQELYILDEEDVLATVS